MFEFAVGMAHRQDRTGRLTHHYLRRAPQQHAVPAGASGDFVGVGEIGFDFHYNHSPREDQFEAFLWQLDLAREGIGTV